MADESKSSEETNEEDPTTEAQRFSALLALLDTNVPELDAWRLADCYGDEFDSEVLSLYEASYLVFRHLFDDDDHPIDVEGVWPRLLAVVEVALEVCDLLFDDAREDDGLVVDVFACSGIMCDITRNVASLEVLLPWMGPVSLDSARIEISNHATSRGYDIDDVDWTKSGLFYRPLAISPQALIPARRT